MIGKLLVYTQVQTTARSYAHLARDTGKTLATGIEDSIDIDLGTTE